MIWHTNSRKWIVIFFFITKLEYHQQKLCPNRGEYLVTHDVYNLFESNQIAGSRATACIHGIIQQTEFLVIEKKERERSNSNKIYKYINFTNVLYFKTDALYTIN